MEPESMEPNATRFAHRAVPARPPGLSVVAPVCDEEPCLDEFARRLTGVLEALGVTFEIILVNDGSRDRSLERMRAIRAADPRVRIVNLSRNFGHQIALTAGLDHARGLAVVLMDADLQDPPELIPALYAKHREGYDVVYATRAQRPNESAPKVWMARLFYRLIRRVTEIDVPVDAADFRILSRRVADALSGMRERHRVLRAMIPWLGFSQAGVPYTQAGRFAGRTKYSLRKMMSLALDGIASFSTVPLRFATWMGAVVSVLAFGYAVFAVAAHYRGATVEGWTSLAVALTFLGGVQLLCLGVIGEYLGRLYEESKRRPLYVVADVDDPAAGAAPGAPEPAPDAADLPGPVPLR